MDQLFPLIIFIIIAIVSVLSKLFKQQKEGRTTSSAPAPKPATEVWRFPWELEEEPASAMEFEKEPVAEKISKVKQFQTKPSILKTGVTEQSKTSKWSSIAPILEIEESINKLDSLGISFKSKDDLVKGIILSEILGPCKAHKKRRNFRELM